MNTFLSSKDVRSLLLFSTLTMCVQGKDCSFTQPCSHFTRLKGSAPAFQSVLEEHSGRRGASSCSYRFRSACTHRVFNTHQVAGTECPVWLPLLTIILAVACLPAKPICNILEVLSAHSHCLR